MLDQTQLIASLKLWGELLSMAQKRVMTADSALLHGRKIYGEFPGPLDFGGEFDACANNG